MIDSSNTFQELILIILALVIIMICVGCIYAFFRSVYLFIFSHWEESKIKSAWTSIRFMVIGIFLTVAFLFVFPYLFKAMNVQDYEAYNAKNIFNKSGELLTKLFQLKDVIQESQEESEYRDQLYFDSKKYDNFYSEYEL